MKSNTVHSYSSQDNLGKKSNAKSTTTFKINISPTVVSLVYNY